MHFSSIPSLNFEEIKPEFELVKCKVKVKASSKMKHHKVSKVVFELKTQKEEEKSEMKEDLKKPIISDFKISTTHKMDRNLL